MAKVQTRRSVSLNRTTYERLKAYCETNGVSMSQFVESRIGDFLGRSKATIEVESSTDVEQIDERRTINSPSSHIFTF